MNEAQMQCKIARWLGWRTHLIVPNVSWGLGLHECDLLSVSRNGYATEIEIKVSVADLRKDKEKQHHHKDSRIKYLYFAMPEAMKGNECDVPDGAGIIYVREQNGWCHIERKATANKQAVALTAAERLHLAELGTMRMWKLKVAIVAGRER